MWLHVDAAYAGATAIIPEFREHFRGCERADSIVVNPHKWLFTPFDLSVLYCKDLGTMKQAFSLVPEYLKTNDEQTVKNGMDYGIQLGRRFRALKFWFVIRYFGREGMIERLREHCRLARLFASWVEESKNFEMMAPVPFALVCFRACPKGVDDLDTLNSVEVQLIDDAQWLSSCDDATLAAGANLALVGDELVQFADAEAIGPGTFRLSKLLRGRFATEGSTATHSSGELFLLIEPASLQSVALPPSARGAVVTATYHGAEGGVSASLMVDGRSLRTGLFIDGEKVVGGRVSAISSPAGGLTVDAEVRTAVSQILGALRTHGLIDS